MSKPRKKSKKILFILEIVVLLLFIGGLFVYGQISAKLDKIDIQETDLADQDIVTNDQAPQMTDIPPMHCSDWTTEARMRS